MNIELNNNAKEKVTSALSIAEKKDENINDKMENNKILQEDRK